MYIPRGGEEILQLVGPRRAACVVRTVVLGMRTLVGVSGVDEVVVLRAVVFIQCCGELGVEACPVAALVLIADVGGVGVAVAQEVDRVDIVVALVVVAARRGDLTHTHQHRLADGAAASEVVGCTLVHVGRLDKVLVEVEVRKHKGIDAGLGTQLVEALGREVSDGVGTEGHTVADRYTLDGKVLCVAVAVEDAAGVVDHSLALVVDDGVHIPVVGVGEEAATDLEDDGIGRCHAGSILIPPVGDTVATHIVVDGIPTILSRQRVGLGKFDEVLLHTLAKRGAALEVETARVEVVVVEEVDVVVEVGVGQGAAVIEHQVLVDVLDERAASHVDATIVLGKVDRVVEEGCRVVDVACHDGGAGGEDGEADGVTRDGVVERMVLFVRVGAGRDEVVVVGTVGSTIIIYVAREPLGDTDLGIGSEAAAEPHHVADVVDTHRTQRSDIAVVSTGQVDVVHRVVCAGISCSVELIVVNLDGVVDIIFISSVDGYLLRDDGTVGRLDFRLGSFEVVVVLDIELRDRGVRTDGEVTAIDIDTGTAVGEGEGVVAVNLASTCSTRVDDGIAVDVAAVTELERRLRVAVVLDDGNGTAGHGIASTAIVGRRVVEMLLQVGAGIVPRRMRRHTDIEVVGHAHVGTEVACTTVVDVYHRSMDRQHDLVTFVVFVVAGSGCISCRRVIEGTGTNLITVTNKGRRFCSVINFIVYSIIIEATTVGVGNPLRVVVDTCGHDSGVLGIQIHSHGVGLGAGTAGAVEPHVTHIERTSDVDQRVIVGAAHRGELEVAARVANQLDDTVVGTADGLGHIVVAATDGDGLHDVDNVALLIDLHHILEIGEVGVGVVADQRSIGGEGSGVV